MPRVKSRFLVIIILLVLSRASTEAEAALVLNSNQDGGVISPTLVPFVGPQFGEPGCGKITGQVSIISHEETVDFCSADSPNLELISRSRGKIVLIPDFFSSSSSQSSCSVEEKYLYIIDHLFPAAIVSYINESNSLPGTYYLFYSPSYSTKIARLANRAMLVESNIFQFGDSIFEDQIVSVECDESNPWAVGGYSWIALRVIVSMLYLASFFKGLDNLYHFLLIYRTGKRSTLVSIICLAIATFRSVFAIIFFNLGDSGLGGVKTTLGVIFQRSQFICFTFFVTFLLASFYHEQGTSLRYFKRPKDILVTQGFRLVFIALLLIIVDFGLSITSALSTSIILAHQIIISMVSIALTIFWLFATDSYLIGVSLSVPKKLWKRLVQISSSLRFRKSLPTKLSSGVKIELGNIDERSNENNEDKTSSSHFRKPSQNERSSISVNVSKRDPSFVGTAIQGMENNIGSALDTISERGNSSFTILTKKSDGKKTSSGSNNIDVEPVVYKKPDRESSELDMYKRMLKAGLPQGAVENAMIRGGIDPAALFDEPVNTSLPTERVVLRSSFAISENQRKNTATESKASAAGIAIYATKKLSSHPKEEEKERKKSSVSFQGGLSKRFSSNIQDFKRKSSAFLAGSSFQQKKSSVSDTSNLRKPSANNKSEEGSGIVARTKSRIIALTESKKMKQIPASLADEIKSANSLKLRHVPVSDRLIDQNNRALHEAEKDLKQYFTRILFWMRSSSIALVLLCGLFVAAAAQPGKYGTPSSRLVFDWMLSITIAFITLSQIQLLTPSRKDIVTKPDKNENVNDTYQKEREIKNKKSVREIKYHPDPDQNPVPIVVVQVNEDEPRGSPEAEKQIKPPISSPDLIPTTTKTTTTPTTPTTTTITSNAINPMIRASHSQITQTLGARPTSVTDASERLSMIQNFFGMSSIQVPSSSRQSISVTVFNDNTNNIRNNGRMSNVSDGSNVSSSSRVSNSVQMLKSNQSSPVDLSSASGRRTTTEAFTRSPSKYEPRNAGGSTSNKSGSLSIRKLGSMRKKKSTKVMIKEEDEDNNKPERFSLATKLSKEPPPIYPFQDSMNGNQHRNGDDDSDDVSIFQQDNVSISSSTGTHIRSTIAGLPSGYDDIESISGMSNPLFNPNWEEEEEENDDDHVKKGKEEETTIFEQQRQGKSTAIFEDEEIQVYNDEDDNDDNN